MMTLITFCLLAAFNEEKREAASSKTVSYFLYALEVHNWKHAASFCTPEAQIHGVPAEQPEKRWSKSITTFLDEKPRWHFKILHWQCFENDGSASVLVDWKQEHLTVQCHFALVRLQNTWKIDGMRFSTRRDAPGAAEQWKRLQGEWEWQPAPQETSLLKYLSLDLQTHQFSVSMRWLGFNLFGPPQADREAYHQDWRIRLLRQENKWFLQLDWPANLTTEGMLAEYEFKGEDLVLQIHYLGARQLGQYGEPVKLVMKRKGK